MMKSSELKSFVPKDNVSLNLGKTTIYVYPHISEEMSNTEKAYSFLVNKSALESADINPKIRLQSLSDLTGTTSLVGILQARHVDHALSFIRRTQSFTVRSYHSPNGLIIPDCLQDDGTLKSVDGQTAVNRRPEDIQYVKIACDVVFSDITPDNDQLYPFTFFIRLHMESQTVTNSIGNDIALRTFFGPDDWATSIDQEILDAIWDHPRSLKKPFNLIPPSIVDPNADAQIRIKECVDTLENLTLTAAWEDIAKKIFAQICPNFVEDPAAIIQGIQQVSYDSATPDQKIILSVTQYFNAIQRLTSFLPKNRDWSIDVTQHFLSHLVIDVRDQMKGQGHSYDPATATRAPFSQISTLQLAFSSAILAETNLQRVRNIAQQELKANHSFHTNLQNNMSVAEKTMTRYQPRECWGCGSSEHVYSDRTGTIFCPRASEPEIKAKFDATRKDFQERRKARTKKYSEKRKSNNMSTVLATLLQDLDADQLRALMATKKQKTESSSPKKDFVTFSTFLCLPADLASKPLLPISVDTNLPHFMLPVGQPESDTAFQLSVAYDTCAVLCVGWAGYHLAIAKQYPHLVKSLTWAKEQYTPLTLSGVVSNDDGDAALSEKLVTTLPAVIEYYMPYPSKQGHPTSFKVAIGDNVAVNTLIGMSMIRPAKFSLDLEDDVIDSGILDTAPFPVTYKQTTRSMPNMASVTNSSEHTLATFTHSHVTLETIKSCISQAFPSKPSLPILVPKPRWRAKTPSHWVEPLEEVDNDKYTFIFKDQLGTTLRKPKNLILPSIPPNLIRYSETRHSKELSRNLVIPVETSDRLRLRITDFVKEFWDVFHEEGVKTPVHGYELVIDTGTHKPIAVKKPHYGLHEIPIMEKTIDWLLSLGHIQPDVLSPWGFRITLAPKPHQEHIEDIKDYVWRFCVNYILLNKITRPAEYPIPRCDDAVMYGFGGATFFILLDAFSGYHQIRLALLSMAKTAFFAPRGRKYCWAVMPFGLRNCPVIFLSMMHDLRELWTQLCIEYGITPADDEGSTIIMDDTFLFSVSEDNAFILVRCVCLIARKYNLTWKLQKTQWFPQKVEFVGVDISVQGNSPAASKNARLSAWKTPENGREIMAFIGFAIFYSRWIPFFEMKIQPLRHLIASYPLDETFTKQFTIKHQDLYGEIKDRILSAPILQRADIKKRFYLKTDFSSHGLGFALCQPDSTPAAIAAMKREDAGGPCEFDLLCKTELRLRPVAFGSRKTIGNEKHFHSHPGESLGATWGSQKNRHFLYGRPYTLMTDCAAIGWLMGYEGHNHAVIRLQLELLSFWFTIAVRPGRMMEDANYFSRLGEDLHIDPLLKDYLSFARQQYVDNPADTGDITPDNLPGRRKSKKPRSEPPTQTTINFANLVLDHNKIAPPFEHHLPSELGPTMTQIPIVFHATTEVQPKSSHHFSYIGEIAQRLQSTSWILYEPKFGHFLQSSRQLALHFEAAIAIESDATSRDFLQTFWNIPTIFDNIDKTIQHLAETSNPQAIQGYYASISEELSSSQQKPFFNLQVTLFDLLRTRSQLQIAIFEIRDNIDSQTMQQFQKKLTSFNWTVTNQTIDFEAHSDQVGGSATFLFAVNDDFHTSSISNLQIRATPPCPNGFEESIYEPFNDSFYCLPIDDDQCKLSLQTDRNFRRPSVASIITIGSDALPSLGYQIYDQDYPAPLPSLNQSGFFGPLFGISFNDTKSKKKLIRAISLAEYVTSFGYDASYNTAICGTLKNPCLLRQVIPARTMAAITNKLQETITLPMHNLLSAQASRYDIDLSVPALFNGIVTHELPADDNWSQAYQNDKNCKHIIEMLANPSLITTTRLQSVDPIYRSAMRNSNIRMHENRLCLFEPIASSTKQLRLVIVPSDLQQQIFTAFHVNPLGGHLSLYYTLHKIRLRFHWPHMYKYIKYAISTCAACLLRNHTSKPASELLYSFPIDAPMLTIHADAWVPGKTNSFDGYTGLMIVMCHMTGFAAIEPLKEMNSKTFAKAVYAIQLRYGLAHMLVIDADSKFKGEFIKAAELLKIKLHPVARGNHDAIMVERFNRFLNSSMLVFNNDRKSNRVFLEGAMMCCYAWNSAPVAGTDLSRALLVLGREFHFPIDFTTRQHLTFNVETSDVKSYASDMLDLLEKCQHVYKLLIHEQRTYHRELRNSQLHHPRKYKLGDRVFARVQVQSNQSKGRVQKLAYRTRGPYKVTKLYPSGSYDLQSIKSPSHVIIKKHGADLYPCPQLIKPFPHVKSSDFQFGNINKGITPNPYENASISEFQPATPWTAPAAFADIIMEPFPSLAQMDAEYDSWPESGNPFIHDETAFAAGHKHKAPVLTNGYTNITTSDQGKISSLQLLSTSTVSRPLSQLVADIIKSDDKLFFIPHLPPNQSRREWKLVQIDFESTMKLHPSCLQDGKFLVQFFIQHFNDNSVNLTDKRYWLEYHSHQNQKTLGLQYHLIPPTSVSHDIAITRNLVPYREWIYLNQPDNLLQGPFNFATINNRKTRDRISTTEWNTLISAHSRYDCQPPQFTHSIVHIATNEQPITRHSDKSVNQRIQAFLYKIHFEDETLETYGTTQ